MWLERMVCKQQDTEERIVLEILRLSGFKKNVVEIRQTCLANAQSHLTLGMLQQRLQGLPLELIAAPHDLISDKEWKLHELSNRSEYKTFRELCDSRSSSMPLGLVFFACHCWLVIHNCQTPIGCSGQLGDEFRKRSRNTKLSEIHRKDDHVVLVAPTCKSSEFVTVQALSNLVRQCSLEWINVD